MEYKGHKIKRSKGRYGFTNWIIDGNYSLPASSLSDARKYIDMELQENRYNKKIKGANNG